MAKYYRRLDDGTREEITEGEARKAQADYQLAQKGAVTGRVFPNNDNPFRKGRSLPRVSMGLPMGTMK